MTKSQLAAGVQLGNSRGQPQSRRMLCGGYFKSSRVCVLGGGGGGGGRGPGAPTL